MPRYEAIDNHAVEENEEMTPSSTRSHPGSRTIASINVPRTQIGFLKVHKAASSTLQSIFLRFGWERNLTFVLPPEFNKFSWPNIISTLDPPNENNTLPPPANKSFDILCHHVLYNKEAWAKYLPLGYAVIGSVRDPWELFFSMLNYMSPAYINRINSSDKVTQFLQDPLRFEPTDIKSSITNNRMSIEFGVDQEIIKRRDFKAFQGFLMQTGKEFDLVIIAEHFDQSLILLKRYLNWSLKDILYVSHNVGKQLKYIPRQTDLAKFKTFSAFDYTLYNFFKQKFEKQISAEGPKFSLEVEYFQLIKHNVSRFCKTIPENMPYISITKSEWNPMFKVNRDDCDLMVKGEIPFTQDIRKRQYGKAI